MAHTTTACLWLYNSVYNNSLFEHHTARCYYSMYELHSFTFYMGFYVCLGPDPSTGFGVHLDAWLNNCKDLENLLYFSQPISQEKGMPTVYYTSSNNCTCGWQFPTHFQMQRVSDWFLLLVIAAIVGIGIVLLILGFAIPTCTPRSHLQPDRGNPPTLNVSSTLSVTASLFCDQSCVHAVHVPQHTQSSLGNANSCTDNHEKESPNLFRW